MPTTYDPKSLLGLPAEIQIIIFTFASKHDTYIEPMCFPRDPENSKFYHGGGEHDAARYFKQIYLTGQVRHDGRLPIALTATELAATCKTIRDIMNETLVFYKTNKFFFEDASHLRRYIREIGPRKAAAIASIDLRFDYPSVAWHEGWKTLQQCSGLKHVALHTPHLPTGRHYHSGLQNIIHICNTENWRKDYELLVSLRGLETFDIYYSSEPTSPFFSHWSRKILTHYDRAADGWGCDLSIEEWQKEEVMVQQKAITAIVTQPRPEERKKQETNNLKSN